MFLSQLLNLLNATPRNGRQRLRCEWTVEGLEFRSLLTTFAWSDPKNMTISFAPDGADIAGNPNQLNSELSQLGLLNNGKRPSFTDFRPGWTSWALTSPW